LLNPPTFYLQTCQVHHFILLIQHAKVLLTGPYEKNEIYQYPLFPFVIRIVDARRGKKSRWNP